MKNILLVIILLSLFACNTTNDSLQKTNFEVTGIIKNAPINTHITLFKRTTNNTITIDSALIIDSTFTLKGKADDLNIFALQVSGIDYYIYLLADSANQISLTADYNKLPAYDVKNSPNSKLIQTIENHLYETNLQIKSAIDSNLDFTQIIKNQQKFSLDFVSKYDTSLAVILALSQTFITGTPVLPIDSFYNSFKNAEKHLALKYSNVEYYNQFCSFVKNYEIQQNRDKPITQLTVQPTEIQDFATTDIFGNDFKLSSLKGNWVLLDFWASWSPSATENNRFIAKIEKNHPEIIIVQISIDKNEQILKDSLSHYNFNHILINDALGWSSDILNLYAVNEIPTFILISPSGKIELFTDDTSQIIDKLR